MPSNIKPMLAKLVKAPFDRDGWLFEIKWDGFRIIAYITDGKAKLISRNNKDYSQIFYPVYQELSHLKSQMILDGEMVVVDKKGRSEFQLLQQFQKTGKGRLVYYVFDLLWLNGKDLRELPLLERKQLLKKHLPTLEYVQISNHILKKGIGFFQAALTHGLEGIIAKDANSPYLSGQRTSYWLKIKTNKRQEAIICGYTAPKGSRKNLGALVLGLYENNHLKYIGHAGSGFNQLTLKDLKTRLDKLAQTESPFEKPPKTNAPVTWVKPQLVCEVKFGEWTKEGHMRQPIFVGLREDKPASSVKQEPVIATPPTNNR